jgi:phage baseplate assembly protein W
LSVQERRSKGFKDISATFKINPINSDLIGLVNYNAIARSVRNLILTVPGERPFNPVLGSGVNALLFNQLDNITSSSIKTEIITTLENFEPRIELNNVIVAPNAEQHRFDVTIQYYIVGIPLDVQEIQIALVPTR